MNSYCATCGEGNFAVSTFAAKCGSDINICVYGGTAPHIGAVSLAVYEPERDSATVSTVTVHTHRDDAVSSYFAKAVSSAMKCTVCASAGIHIDNASADEIALMRENAAKCCTALIEKLTQN